MRRISDPRAKLFSWLAVALSGGTLFGACETRIRDAIVSGTRGFVLDPVVGPLSALFELPDERPPTDG